MSTNLSENSPEDEGVDRKGFANRVKSLIGAGVSLTKFAEDCGVPLGTLRGYLKESYPPKLDVALKIARSCEVSLDWLIAGEGALTKASAPIDERTLVAVPRFDVQVAAGGGAVPALQEPNDSFYVARDWLYRFVPPSVQISMIEVVGDSMDPTIRDGDVLLIRHDRTTLQSTIGNVIVLTLDDLLFVKRLQVSDNGEMLLTSDNEFYTPMHVPRREWDERVRIHGLAFWHGGPIRKR